MSTMEDVFFDIWRISTERTSRYYRLVFAILMYSMFYDGTAAQACGGDISNTQGIVASPGYGKAKYEHDLVCIWRMHFNPTDRITIVTADLKVEWSEGCQNDNVTVKFSDKEEQIQCGFKEPTTPATGAGPVTIQFMTNERINYRGFYMRYIVRQGVLPPLDSCQSNPCLNDGTCVNERQGSYYSCSCTENYTGKSCEIELGNESKNYCDPFPCLNGATCISGESDYNCSCVEGWEGKHCETKIQDEPETKCDSNPCLNHGVCTDTAVGYECECVGGWEGINCEIDRDECLSNPCQNGGICTDLQNGFSCQCQEGWSGDTCLTDMDECASNPCSNGGTCRDEPNGFLCDCLSGWSGTYCSVATDADQCSSNPCKNGGKCIDGDQQFSCRCSRGWTGTTCSININDCVPNPCKHGGICTDKVSDYECICTEIWMGRNCEIKNELALDANQHRDPNDPCNPNPCFNEAECHDLGGGDVFCLCEEGFSGDLCEEGENACIPNPCQNEGRCIKWQDDYTCTCKPGWEGDDCEENIDECLSDPCERSLVCVDKVNGYKCREECDPGFTGDECEIEIDECESQPCENEGTCFNEINSFACSCAFGFQGTLCEIDNPCDESPCRNGGTCHNSTAAQTNSTRYICACQLGWDGMTCEEKVVNGCPNPDGVSTDLVPYGISLEFFCSDGFVLTGPGLITCLRTGEFTSIIPQCIQEGGNPSALSASVLKSPMVLSMLGATGIIVLAIFGFLSYIFYFAPWNRSGKKTQDHEKDSDEK